MNAELVSTLQETIAKKVYGSGFKDLAPTEASNVSEAAFAALKDVVQWAKANWPQFGIEVDAAKPAVID